MEYAPLLASGFQDIKLEELERIFLLPFSNSVTRANILKEFNLWVKRIKKLKVKCEIWIDGSFATEKVDPQDIDVVIFISSSDIRKLTAEKKLELETLTNQRLTEQQRKESICDSYLAFSEDVLDRRFWEKTFGKSRQETPKGIFRIFI